MDKLQEPNPTPTGLRERERIIKGPTQIPSLVPERETRPGLWARIRVSGESPIKSYIDFANWFKEGTDFAKGLASALFLFWLGSKFAWSTPIKGIPLGITMFATAFVMFCTFARPLTLLIKPTKKKQTRLICALTVASVLIVELLAVSFFGDSH